MGATKKIQQKKKEKAKQALHNFLTPPPKELGVIIKLVNSLPTQEREDLHFLRFPVEELHEKLLGSEVSEYSDEWVTQQIDELMIFLKSIPREIALWYLPSKYVDRSSDPELRREFLVWVNGRIDMFDNFKGTLKSLSKTEERNIEIGVTTHIPTHIYVNQDGIMELKSHFFLEALDGVDINRIRECPVCNSIFWAGRTTQQCCTPRCSNIFRVRRHRFRSDEEKGELKLKRIKREENKPRGKDK